MVQYCFENEEYDVIPRPHKNSKQEKPYRRTAESTRQWLKNLSKENQAKATFHQVLEDQGGILNGHCAGQFPRDRKQITNMRHIDRHKPDETDVISQLMEKCKQQQCSPSTAFIRELSLSPEPEIVLAFDWQLDDIVRFCTNPAAFSILGVDATYNIGNFFVTLTTYNHLLLKTKEGNHPVMPGPVLIHQRKLFSSYYLLPSTMVKLNKNCKNVLVIGSDDEQNLYEPFKSVMDGAHHLLCDLHMKDNISSKLTNLGIKGVVESNSWTTYSVKILEIVGYQGLSTAIPQKSSRQG